LHLQDSYRSTPLYSEKKKAKNENFNVDKFNKLSLSNNKLESDNNSDTGSDGEGKERPHNVIATVVSRNLCNHNRKKQRTEFRNSTLDKVLQESCKLVLDSTFLNDNVSRHAISDNEKSRNDSINYNPKTLEDSEAIKEVMVETINEHNNKSVMDAPHSCESTTNEEAFVLCQVSNKSDKPTIGKLAKLAPILFACVCTGLGRPWSKDA